MAVYNFATGKWEASPQLPTLTVAKPQPQPRLTVTQAKPTQTIKVARTFYRDEGGPNTGKRYSDPKEFLAAGGDWNKIIVKKATPKAENGFPQKLTVTNQPANQGVITKVVGAPPSKIKSLEEWKKESLPSQSVAKNFIKELPRATGKVLLDIARSIPRTGISVLSSALNPGDAQPIVPETRAQKLLVGDEPIIPIARQTADYELKLKDKGFGPKTSIGLAMAGSITPAFLDLFPGGQGKKGVVKQLATTTDIKTISRLLKGAGVADDIVKELAPQIAKTSNEQLIAKSLEGAAAKAIKREFVKNIPLYNQAKQEIDTLAKEAAGNNPVITAPIKSVKRSVEKTIADYKGDLSQLKDAARNTIVISDPSATPNILRQFSYGQIKGSMSQAGPLGYRGVIMHVPTKAGVFAEIQMASPEMIYGKAASEQEAIMQLGKEVVNQIKKTSGVKPAQGHIWYEQWRSIDAKLKNGVGSKRDYDELKRIAQESNQYYERLSISEAKRLASSSEISNPSRIALANTPEVGTKPLPGSYREVTNPPSAVGSNLTKLPSTSKKVNLSNTDINTPSNANIPRNKPLVKTGYSDEFKGAGEAKEAIEEVRLRTGEKMVKGELDISRLRATQTTKDMERLDRVRKEIKSGGRFPIVVEYHAPNFYDVVDGNTRLAVYKEIGISKVPVIVNKSGLRNTKLGGVKLEERGFIKSVNKAVPDANLSNKKIIRNTEKLAIRAKNLVKDDIDRAERVAKETTDKGVATASELIKHYKGIAARAKSTAEKNLALDKLAIIANESAENLTAAGRTVQAAKILGMQTPEGQLRFASRLIQKYNEDIAKRSGIGGLRKKIPELTGEQAKDILDESKRVFGMPDGEAKAIAYQKLQDKIKGLVPSPVYKQIITLWKAGLLTGVKTSGLNIASNVSHTLTETIKDVPAVVVDKIASLITGKRTMALTGRGSKKGIAEGFKKGLRYLRTGFDERNVGEKLDYSKVNITFLGKKASKAAQVYEETVFKIIGAEDQPFYYGAKAKSLYSQAIAQAKNKGLKGAERTKFIEDLVANPTDEMAKYAVHDAEIAVFQNQTALGQVAKMIQRIPGFEVIVPFGRTPAAVATQLINYSPAGFVKTIIEQVARGKFDQRLFSQGVGRASVGTGVMFAGMELYKKGRIALGYPKEEREKRQWELEGKKPNSIKIGNKWRSIATLGPAGNVLVMGGYLQKGIEDTGSFTEALSSAGFGGAKSLTEQTFLKGLNSFVQAIDDPETYGQSLLGNLLGSGVPTLVSDIAQSMDRTQRRSNPKRDGFLSPVQSRIPGLRKKLEPKINAEGMPVQRSGNPIETLLDPTRPSKIGEGPLIKELRRLSDAGFMATPTYFADDKKWDISAREKTNLQMDAGQLFKRKVLKLFETEDYKNASDEQKAKLIIDFSDQARIAARVSYVNTQTEGLEGEELTKKLSELKKKGVMTKEVYEKWEKQRQRSN